jgi:hypothetical protein
LRIGKNDYDIYGMAAAGRTAEIYRVDEIIKVHNMLICVKTVKRRKEVRL